MVHHTKKTVDAADEICQMISISSPLLSRTPFFTCAIALQALVHLGAYSLPQYKQRESITAQQIQMSLGALKRLSEVWEMASTVLTQVMSVARTVLNTSGDCSTPKAAADSVSAQRTLGDGTFDDVATIRLNDVSQVNDDAWFDEFLGRRILG